MIVDLYIDFDGVILDTMTDAYKEYEEYKRSDDISSREYFEKLDWNTLLQESDQINNSIDNIKMLMDSGLYNVSVLTHVVCEAEIVAKVKFLGEKIPGLNVITVDKRNNKCDVVNCANAVLVDDYMENLELWAARGGIAIKFSDKNKRRQFMTIDSLDDLIDKYDDIISLIKM